MNVNMAARPCSSTGRDYDGGHRFQIFLTSSLEPKNQDRQSFPYGVWDVMKWMVDQLDPAYRLQADASVERLITTDAVQNFSNLALGLAMRRNRDEPFHVHSWRSRSQTAGC